jgi:large subunit ribosomal protein L15
MTKTKKYRGSNTHGRGNKKKGRGKGGRGGKGMAGSKKHRQIKPGYFGKRGFKPPRKKTIKTINVKDLKNQKEINLKKEGYDKLLGTGSVNTPIKVTVSKATTKAREKIEKAGGEIVDG